MKIARSDRRSSHRFVLRIPLRVRLWKSLAPEQSAESVNLSQNGVYFATSSPLREGETVEILLSMPEAITNEPTADWRCTGHVVRVDRADPSGGSMGIGVQFDCYEVAHPRSVGSPASASSRHAQLRDWPIWSKACSDEPSS